MYQKLQVNSQAVALKLAKGIQRPEQDEGADETYCPWY